MSTIKYLWMDCSIKITDRVYISVLMKKDSTKNIFVDKMNKTNKYLILLLDM
jgi:hypothetical protein